MAKNIIEQFLDYASAKLVGPLSTENIYLEEVSGKTGVEKYLARQEAAAMPQEGGATGVEKYLARQAALSGEPIQEAAVPAESLTGVAKYLARTGKAPEPATAAAVAEEPTGPLSGVAKYLARQGKAPGQAPASVAVAEPKAPLSGVAKYLAGQGMATGTTAGAAPSGEPESPLTRVAKYLAGFEESHSTKANAAPAPTTGVGKYLANKGGASALQYQEPKIMTSASDIEEEIVADDLIDIDEEAIAMAEPVSVSLSNAEETNSPENPKSIEPIVILDDGVRCQASTSKGAQCKITNGLSHIQRTIDEQTYQFSVCKQHDNDKFKPYPALLTGGVQEG